MKNEEINAKHHAIAKYCAMTDEECNEYLKKGLESLNRWYFFGCPVELSKWSELEKIAKASRSIVKDADAQNVTTEDKVEAIVIRLLSDEKTLAEIKADALSKAEELLSNQYYSYKYSIYRDEVKKRFNANLSQLTEDGAGFGPLSCFVLDGPKISYNSVEDAVKAGLVNNWGLVILSEAENKYLEDCKPMNKETEEVIRDAVKVFFADKPQISKDYVNEIVKTELADPSSCSAPPEYDNSKDACIVRYYANIKCSQIVLTDWVNLLYLKYNVYYDSLLREWREGFHEANKE